MLYEMHLIQHRARAVLYQIRCVQQMRLPRASDARARVRCVWTPAMPCPMHPMHARERARERERERDLLGTHQTHLIQHRTHMHARVSVAKQTQVSGGICRAFGLRQRRHLTDRHTHTHTHTHTQTHLRQMRHADLGFSNLTSNLYFAYTCEKVRD